MAKAKEQEIKFVDFENLTFNREPILYNSGASQAIGFSTQKRTSKGVKDVRLSHIFKPLSDQRFLQRELEFFRNEKKSLDSIEPTKSFWRDLISEVKGYGDSPDWKDKMPFEHIVNSITALLHIQLIEDEADDSAEDVFDFDELICLRFHALFGGIPYENWVEWLTLGDLPSNLSGSFNNEKYAEVCRKVKDGISPTVLLEVKHFFNQESQAQMAEFLLIQQGRPRKGVLASAAKTNEETKAERLIDLWKQINAKTENYESVSAGHQAHAAEMFFALQLSELGKPLV